MEKKTQLRLILTAAHHEFEKNLNSYAFFKTQNHEMGEGLVQDTYMKTWIYLAKGGKIGIMKAFLYHILNNLIVDEYRKHKTVSLDSLADGGFEPSGDDSTNLLDLLDGKKALLLIQQLPVKYQKVMRMKYVQDLSLKEMAQVTGESKNALAVMAHRGLEKLKSLYFA